MQHLYFAYATYVAYATPVFRICNICCIYNTFIQEEIFFLQKVPDEIFFNAWGLIPAPVDSVKLKRKLQLSKNRPGGRQNAWWATLEGIKRLCHLQVCAVC